MKIKTTIKALAFAASMTGLSATAQSFTMENNDTIFIDGINQGMGTIYDNGGPSYNYSNYFNGWVVITSIPGSPITLAGDYELESPTWDYLYVWDGDEATGTTLVNRVGNSGSISVTATSGRMTIYFHSDASVNYSGFALAYTACTDTVGRVSGLTIDTVTATSATFHWQSSSSLFHVFVDGVETATTTQTSYTALGLNPASRHTLTVYPDGPQQSPCLKSSVSFRTACGTTTPPLIDDFEDYTVGDMPPCWTRATNFDNESMLPRVYQLTSRDKVLMLSSGNNYTASHYGMVISPNIVSSSTEWLIAFQVRASHYGTVVEVGFCDSTSSQQQQFGFIPVDTLIITNNTVWDTLHKNYTVPSGHSRIAFRMVQNMQSGTGRMLYLNDVTVESCGIREASVAHVDTSSAILSWTTHGNPTVTVSLRPNASYSDEQTITNATSPLTVTGLTPGMYYTAIIRPQCDPGQATLSRELEFTTLSLPQDCELCGSINSSSGWFRIMGNSISYSSYLPNGAIIVSPQMCGLGGKEVTIQYNNSYTYVGDSIEVGTLSWYEDTSTFTPFAVIAAQSTTNTNRRVKVPDGISDRWLGLRGKCNGGSNIYINYISLSDCEVDNMRITSAGSTTINVAWDYPVSDSVIVDHYISWDGQHSLDTLAGVTSYTISDLDSDTYYYVNVYPICGRPCRYLSTSVRTAMRDYSLPLCEDFETSVFSSSYGWYRTNSGYFYWTTSQSHSGDYSLRFYSVSPGSNTYLFAPPMGSLSGTTLSFWGYSMAPQTMLIVGLYNGNTHSGTYYSNLFTPLDTIPINYDGYWHHYSTSIPTSTTGVLTFKYISANGYIDQSMWLDDLQIGNIGFDQFTFDNVDSSSADIVCHLVGGATCYAAMLVGAVDDVYSTPDTLYAYSDSDTLHVTGLMPNRRYHCFTSPCDASDTLCRVYAGSFATTLYSNGTPRGLIPCNIMDDLLSYELPAGWLFDNSEVCALATGRGLDGGDALGIALSSSLPHTTITIPAVPEALYLTARSVSGTASISVETDTVYIDTAWTGISFAPSHDSTKIVIHIMGNDTVFLDNVGLSNCPVVTFSAESNSIRCITPKMAQAEYILTVVGPSGDTVRHHVTDTSYVLTGLMPSATYTLSWDCPYFASGCIPTIKVQTMTISLPYCADLYSTNLPEGWQVIGEPNDYHYAGSYYSFYSSPSTPHWQYIILPEVEDYTSLHLHTYVYNTGSPVNFEIGVLTDPTDTSTFVSAASFEGVSSSGHFRADLSNLPHGRIALRNRAGNLRLDYIRLNNTPYVHAHLYRPDTVTFTAESAGSFYIKHGNSSSNIDSLVFVDTTPFSLPVTPEGYLYYYIMPDSTTQGCDSYSYLYTYNMVNIPYCQDFSDYNESRSFGYTYLNGSSYFISRSSDNGDYHIYLSVNSDSRFFTMPYVDADTISDLSVNFRYKIPYYYYPDTITTLVGIMADRYNPSTFDTVDTLRLVVDGQWHAASFNYSSYAGSAHWPAIFLPSYGQSTTLYIDDMHFQPCQSEAYLTAIATLDEWSKVRIDNVNTDMFYAEYGTEGFMPGTGTMLAVDSLPLVITLDPETTYDILFRCSNAPSSCPTKARVTTLGLPLTIPECVDFDSCSLYSLPHRWISVSGSPRVYSTESHSGNNSLLVDGTVTTPYIDLDSIAQLAMGLWVYFPDGNSNLIIGSMTDPTDAYTFHTVKSFSPNHPGEWEYVYVDFREAPQNAHFVALRSTSSYRAMVDDLHFTTCMAYGLHVDNIDNNTINLSWEQVGSPTVVFTVAEDNNAPTVHVAEAAMSSISIPLNPLQHYTMAMHASCNDTLACAHEYNDTLELVAPADGLGCINATNLFSSDAVFFSGSYNNPYSNEGAVDYGQNDVESRHTVCYDTSARDPRTGGLLRTIPEGYAASVRLGNWGSNPAMPEAEGVIYSLAVDTADFELILLRYAAVLQDPQHAPEDQPRFRIEVLDSAMTPIDPSCTAADFVADASLGWNQAPNNVLWKDWTTVGIDLSNYANQQVYIRLTTFDCNEGSHYGYAYFTLECMRKNMESTACGDIDSNTFTAPAGFNYRWYSSESAATISTAQSITMATADVTFYCDLSKVDNPACLFTISAYGGTRYPMASFDTALRVEDCRFYLTLTNTSAVSADGLTPIPGEGCEDAWWDFGNGQYATTYHASTVYTLPGTYTVRLVSAIAGGACSDTATMTLTLAIPDGMMPTDTTLATICSNETYSFFDSSYSTEGTFSYATPNTGGCDSIHYLLLQVNPVTVGDTTAMACDSFSWYGMTSTSDTLLTRLGQNSLLCDSTTRLHLTILHSTTAIIEDTIVENQLPYSVTFVPASGGTSTGRTFTDSVEHEVVIITNSAGCDSTIDYSLRVHRNVSAVADSTVCSNHLPLQWHSRTFSSAGVQKDTLLAHTGADSVLTMRVFVMPVYADTVRATICDNETFAFEDSVHATGGFHNHLLHTALYGCDSLRTLELTVHPTSNSDTLATACDSFSWRGYNFAVDSAFCGQGTPCTYSQRVPTGVLNAYGCDSTRTLLLTLRASTDTVVTHFVVENDLPYSWNGLLFAGDTANAVLTLANGAGCDSTITFNLTVFANSDTIVFDTLCEGTLPMVWNGVSFLPEEIEAATGAIVHQATLRTVNGADSVVTMRLLVLRNSTATIADTILQKDLAGFAPPLPVTASYQQNENDPPLVTIVDTTMVLTNAAGCDSTVHYTLSLYRNYHADDSGRCCDNETPFVWEDHALETTTTMTDTLASLFGTDSVVTFHLTVYPTYDVNDTHIICPHQPYMYEGVDYGGPIAFDSPHTTVEGCDSLVHVALVAADTARRVPTVSLDNGEWLPYDTLLLGCQPSQLRLRDSSFALSRSWTLWQWEVDSGQWVAGSVGNDSIFTADVDSPGIFSFQLIAVSAEGCRDTVRKDSLLWVFPRPRAAFSFSPSHLSIHNPEAQFYNQSSPLTALDSQLTVQASYLWLFPQSPGADSYDSSLLVDPYYAWEVNTDTGEYEVSLIAYWHYLIPHNPLPLPLTCTDTATAPVSIVNTYLQFPNSVTPNDDGVNDRWEVVNLLEMGEYTMNELWIYDRFGAPVYHVRDISKPSDFWDPNQTNSPDGTYYFRFLAKNDFGVVKRNGVIEVSR